MTSLHIRMSLLSLWEDTDVGEFSKVFQSQIRIILIEGNLTIIIIPHKATCLFNINHISQAKKVVIFAQVQTIDGALAASESADTLHMAITFNLP